MTKLNFSLTKEVLILPNEGFLFMLNSKCASSSIRRMAMYKLGYKDLIYLQTEEEINDCQIPRWIMVVRNPFDRIVSMWADKTQKKRLYRGFKNLNMQKGMPFNAFVKAIYSAGPLHKLNGHLWPQTIIAKYYWDRLDILKIENLQKIWPKELPPLEHENQTKLNIDYNKLLDKETRALIHEIYADDIGALPYE
jgi:hypothetical protein